MSVFKNLREMHNKFGFKKLEKPGLLDYHFMKFRIKFLQEELDELEKAHNEKDLAEVIDALIDISVVAIGTLDLMGVNGQAHWNEVHYKNMQKIVVRSAENSKRKFAIDLEKPEGWTSPDHKRVLDNEL